MVDVIGRQRDPAGHQVPFDVVPDLQTQRLEQLAGQGFGQGGEFERPHREPVEQRRLRLGFLAARERLKSLLQCGQLHTQLLSASIDVDDEFVVDVVCNLEGMQQTPTARTVLGDGAPNGLGVVFALRDLGFVEQVEIRSEQFPTIRPEDLLGQECGQEAHQHVLAKPNGGGVTSRARVLLGCARVIGMVVLGVAPHAMATHLTVDEAAQQVGALPGVRALFAA